MLSWPQWRYPSFFFSLFFDGGSGTAAKWKSSCASVSHPYDALWAGLLPYNLAESTLPQLVVSTSFCSLGLILRAINQSIIHKNSTGTSIVMTSDLSLLTLMTNCWQAPRAKRNFNDCLNHSDSNACQIRSGGVDGNTDHHTISQLIVRHAWISTCPTLLSEPNLSQQASFPFLLRGGAGVVDEFVAPSRWDGLWDGRCRFMPRLQIQQSKTFSSQERPLKRFDRSKI